MATKVNFCEWLLPSGPKRPAGIQKKCRQADPVLLSCLLVATSICRAPTDPAEGSTLVAYRSLSDHGPSRAQKDRPALGTPPGRASAHPRRAVHARHRRSWLVNGASGAQWGVEGLTRM